jgi:simple sugar transport system ATP-binding protein
VGLVRPDAGALRLGGRHVDLAGWDPAAALAAGVRMVHQHSALVPAMTVAENLAFGDRRGGFRFRPERARKAAQALARRFDLEVATDRRVEDLAPGERQRAEILRALDRGAQVLVLDEPTAVLTPDETRRLFASLRRLRDAGRAVIFISHKLAEVEEISDRVTVLRRGRVTARLRAGEADASELGRRMLGADLPAVEPRPGRPGEPLLEIRGVCAAGVGDGSGLRELDLAVRAGEIVGVVGIDGNGQRELEEVLAGVRRPGAGRILVGGEPVAPDPRSLRRAGLAHLSGDRESAGLVAGLSVAENLILKGSYDDRRFFRRGWLDAAAARRAARETIRRYGIVPPDPDAPCGSLSGGNAQKLAVAREFDGDPKVLVAVNPTRGLDAGSTRFVHERLLARRDAGAAVLLVSTELDEVIALADRLVALVRGRVLPVPAGADRGAIGAILLGEAGG